jgi:hypothetical protein
MFTMLRTNKKKQIFQMNGESMQKWRRTTICQINMLSFTT